MKTFLGRRAPTRSEEVLPLPLAGPEAVYRLKRSSARRTLALRVSDAGEVAVNAPLRLPQREVDLFLAKHAGWLRQRLEAAQSRVFQWREGAELPWLGASLILRLLAPAGGPGVRREDGHLLCAAEPPSVPAVVKRWYQGQARELLAQRLATQCARLGREPPPLRLSDARTRWGSLSPRGVVSLNWRLVKASPKEIDYVICHELAHFKQRNHSPAFWREVGALFPDYPEARAALGRRGSDYFDF